MDLEKSGSSLFLINSPPPFILLPLLMFSEKKFWLRFLIINSGSQIFYMVLILVLTLQIALKLVMLS